MKKTVIAGIVLLILAAALYLVIRIRENSRFRNDELRSCQVSSGGGMLGGYRIFRLERDEEGNAILTVEEKQMHAERLRTSVYQVDQGAFEQMKKIVDDYDLYAASKRRYSDMIALDGETTSLHFYYSEGSFSISQQQELSKKMSDGFRKAESFLYSLAKGDPVVSIEPQQASLYLDSGYTLQFLIEDGFDGRLDGILSEGYEVRPYEDKGIVVAEAEGLDVSQVQPVEEAAAGSMVYDGGLIVILYEDCRFNGPAYLLGALDGYVDSACPLIAEMKGTYSFYLN